MQVTAIAGMMRIKNEARWIKGVLSAALECCEQIHVLEDHSTDDTAAICASLGERVKVHCSPFSGLDEARDKNWLLDQIRRERFSWILSIDGDEQLVYPELIREAAESSASDSFALQVLYLWGDNTVRTDGVYGRFWRPSLFRLRAGSLSFRSTRNGGNFHCGNVPREITGSAHCGARLLHFGYMDAADRRRKFDWYNRQDPNNEAEDRYRHMIQGDDGGPPPQQRLRHAGPIALERLQ